jgi:hypothetical protein
MDRRPRQHEKHRIAQGTHNNDKTPYLSVAIILIPVSHILPLILTGQEEDDSALYVQDVVLSTRMGHYNIKGSSDNCRS